MTSFSRVNVGTESQHIRFEPSSWPVQNDGLKTGKKILSQDVQACCPCIFNSESLYTFLHSTGILRCFRAVMLSELYPMFFFYRQRLCSKSITQQSTRCSHWLIAVFVVCTPPRNELLNAREAWLKWLHEN